MSDLLDGFKDLAGINVPKDIQHRPITAFEKLVNTSYKLLANDAPREDKPWNHLVTYIYPRGVHHLPPYLALYNRLKQELSEVDFTVDDLVTFILSGLNNDEGDYLSNPHSNTSIEQIQFAIGIYTGCLLHILTERNRSIGKPTNIYLNGNGSAFPFLFAFAKEFDEIVVENFKGDYICGFLGSFEGHGNTVVITNCEGNSIFDEAGINKGFINNIIMVKNKCRSAGHNTAAFGGEIKNIVLVGNEIQNCFDGVGKSGRVSNFFLITSSNTPLVKSNAVNFISAGSSFKPREVYKPKKDDAYADEIYTKHGYVGNIVILNQTPFIGAGHGRNLEITSTGSNYGYVDRLISIGPNYLSGIASDHGRVRILLYIEDAPNNDIIVSNVASKGGVIDNLMIKKDGRYKVIKGINGINLNTKKEINENYLEFSTDPNDEVSIHSRIQSHSKSKIQSKVNCVLVGDEAQCEYQKLTHEEKLDELVSFAQSLEGKSYREILALLEKLPNGK